MMAGNPNYWSMNSMHPQSHQLPNSQFVYGSNNNNNFINININDNNNNNNFSSVITSDSTTTTNHPGGVDDFPVRSWSQLLMGGCEEGRFGASVFQQQQKKMENWEEHQVLNLNNSLSSFGRINNNNINNNININNDDDDDDNDQVNRSWPHHIVSSPTSSVTSLSNNFLNFSGGGKAVAAAVAAATQVQINHHHNQDQRLSECNSTSSGMVSKKARVQQSSTQPALKVRKEKLGDRITALHQLVSPFGKTDTASVLSEAIGYIRFLQGQIEALSSPFMHNTSANSVQERNSLFPKESETSQDSQNRGVNDLRSRGLCLVPISCTENVGNDNIGADYWAPTALGGGF